MKEKYIEVSHQQADTCFELGKDLQEKGEYQESSEFYKKAQIIFEEIGDTERANQAQQATVEVRRDEAQHYYNVGNKFRRLRRYQKALSCYKQARIIFEEVGDTRRAIKAQHQYQNIRTLLEIFSIIIKNINLVINLIKKIRSLVINLIIKNIVIYSNFWLKQLWSILRVLAVAFVACGIGAFGLAWSALTIALEKRRLLFEYCIIFTSLAIHTLVFLINYVYRLILTLFDLISQSFLKIFQRLSIPVRLGLVVWTIWLIKIIEEQNFDFKMPWEKPEIRTPIVDRAVQYTAPHSVYRVTCPPNQLLNVRESPSFLGSVVSTIPCNSIGVEIIGSDILADGEIWVKIQYQTIHGWSVKRFLSHP